MKKLLFLLALIAPPLSAQAVRYNSNVYTINSSAPLPGALYPVLANTSATVQICTYSTTQSCPALATTYTDATAGTACPTTAQLTPSNSGACTASVDAQGNFGAWIAAGNYQYVVKASYGTFGPFPFTVGGAGGSIGITQLTGDVTAGPGSGSVASTLATVNSGPGTCGDSTHVCQVITNGKGLTTAQNQVAITAGSGTVSTVSVATANGFQGTVANPTTTPVITINVDSNHLLPNNLGSSSTYLNGAGTYTTPSGSGIPTSPTNAIVKINGSNGAASSISDNGTTVSTTEPVSVPSLTTIGPCATGGTGGCIAGNPGSATTPTSGKDILNDVTGIGWQESINGGALGTICTAVNAAGTSGCQGSGGVTPLQLRTLTTPVAGTENFGDSTVAGWGASTPIYVFGAQLQNDLPGTWLFNYGIAGMATNQISQQSWAKWDAVNGPANPLVTYQGGINDANTTGATTGSENNATLATIAGAGHIAIPFANQTLSSVAAHTGTWAAAGSFGLGLASGVTGTFTSSSTNGSTRTYSLGSLANGVYVWGAADASAGTFTVSVNGTLQTNLCTGTTTFDSFGCNAQTFGFGGFSILGQTFANSNTGCDCLVVTVTSSTSGSNVVYDGAVMMIPTGLAAGVLAGTNSLVGIQGVEKQQADTDSSATAALNAAVQAGYTALFSAGVTNLFFADPRNGVSSGGSTYPSARALNTTTDYGPPGGGPPLHLGNVGYFALARIYESAAAAAGFPVAVQNVGSRAQTSAAGQIYWPANLPGDYSNDNEINPTGETSSTLPMPGQSWYSSAGPRSTPVSRTAFESSPSFNLFGNSFGLMHGGPTGVGCTFANPTSGSTCGSVWSASSNGAFHYWTQHFGAGTPNGSITVPAVSTINAISIDSQQTATGAVDDTHTASIVHLQSGATSVTMKPCQSTSAIFGTNWLTWYMIDDASTLASLTFNHYSGVGNTDTINGASSQTYTSIPPHTVFQAQCSQATGTTTTITVSELLTNPSSGGGGAAGTYFTTAGYAGGAVTSSANLLTCGGFIVPSNGLSVGHVSLLINVDDPANNSDVGFYSGTGTLEAHVGATEFGSTGTVTLAFVGGTQTLAAGKSFYCITTANASPVFQVGAVINGQTFLPFAATSITSTGGALPSSITPPTDAPSTVANLPSFVLEP